MMNEKLWEDIYQRLELLHRHLTEGDLSASTVEEAKLHFIERIESILRSYPKPEIDLRNNREAKHPVQEIADAVGGTIKEMGRLPDGSGFAVMSMPLPKDHWLTENQEGFNVPPMPFRMGGRDFVSLRSSIRNGTWRFWNYFKFVVLSRQEVEDRILSAGKYAVRCATMNGKDMDFDPDAMLQNLLVGTLGYYTEDGLSSDEWANPKKRERWCCEGDGQDGHHKKCRYSRNDYAGASTPMQQG